MNQRAEAACGMGRTAEAVQRGSDSLRLAPMRCRGGLPIHVLVCLAAEKQSLSSIESQLSSLSPADRHQLVLTLRQTDADRESAEVLFRRDLALAMEVAPTYQRLVFFVPFGPRKHLEAQQVKYPSRFKNAAAARAAMIQKLQ